MRETIDGDTLCSRSLELAGMERSRASSNDVQTQSRETVILHFTIPSRMDRVISSLFSIPDQTGRLRLSQHLISLLRPSFTDRGAIVF